MKRQKAVKLCKILKPRATTTRAKEATSEHSSEGEKCDGYAC
jgi:hypothetical protein